MQKCIIIKFQTTHLVVNKYMHDVMEPSMCSPFTFISSEIPETSKSKKRESTKSTRSQRRMNGGADDRTSTSTSKTMNKISETGTHSANKAQKSLQQSRSSTQDVQACTTNMLNSLQAVAGSESTKEYPSTSSLLNKAEDSLKKRSLDNGTICSCTPWATKSTGDKRIDEMMDYAIQNLNEAGKALTNLGDNFEHDLKLMFMDIMGRVQHWVSVVQNRIHAAKADLDSLREESIARVSELSTKDLELLALRIKLDEVEASLAAEQKKKLEMISNAADNLGQVDKEKVSTSMQTDINKDEVKEGDKLQRGSEVMEITLADTGCQCADERDKATNRVAELEAELAKLLKENDRMVKEWAEYENAIHCALLKGVSSLNIEALKVLRYPPIPCCAPCGLSPLHSSSQEPVITECPRTTRCDTVAPQPMQRRSNTVSKNDKNDQNKGKNGSTSINCCQPLSEHLRCCNGGNEKYSENSMIFLLHHGDEGNPCKPCIQARYRPNASLSTKGIVCVGGKCKKPATTSTKEKVSCAARSPRSRPALNDLCVRNRNDSSENTTARKNTLLVKRCGACNGNRRNRDD